MFTSIRLTAANTVILLVLAFRPIAAQEATAGFQNVVTSARAANSVAPLTISSADLAAALSAPTASDGQDAAAPPPRAFEYSDAYRLRAKVHKVASIATLPLFGAEVIVGQKLYNNPQDGPKGAHGALAAGIGTLFGINSVTGVWNLMEARKDPNHSTKRWVHGLLMLGADAGFVATAALGPHEERFEPSQGSKATHRAVAFSSMGVATVGYLVMLLGGGGQ